MCDQASCSGMPTASTTVPCVHRDPAQARATGQPAETALQYLGNPSAPSSRGIILSTDPLLNETKGEDIAVLIESDDAGWLLELADDELLRGMGTSDRGEHDIIWSPNSSKCEWSRPTTHISLPVNAWAEFVSQRQKEAGCLFVANCAAW